MHSKRDTLYASITIIPRPSSSGLTPTDPKTSADDDDDDDAGRVRLLAAAAVNSERRRPNDFSREHGRSVATVQVQTDEFVSTIHGLAISLAISMFNALFNWQIF